jgi:hypothetical protein
MTRLRCYGECTAWYHLFAQHGREAREWTARRGVYGRPTHVAGTQACRGTGPAGVVELWHNNLDAFVCCPNPSLAADPIAARRTVCIGGVPPRLDVTERT